MTQLTVTSVFILITKNVLLQQVPGSIWNVIMSINNIYVDVHVDACVDICVDIKSCWQLPALYSIKN